MLTFPEAVVMIFYKMSRSVGIWNLLSLSGGCGSNPTESDHLEAPALFGTSMSAAKQILSYLAAETV
jgi:hypothetical protein